MMLYSRFDNPKPIELGVDYTYKSTVYLQSDVELLDNIEWKYMDETEREMLAKTKFIYQPSEYEGQSGCKNVYIHNETQVEHSGNIMGQRRKAFTDYVKFDKISSMTGKWLKIIIEHTYIETNLVMSGDPNCQYEHNPGARACPKCLKMEKAPIGEKIDTQTDLAFVVDYIKMSRKDPIKKDRFLY